MPLFFGVAEKTFPLGIAQRSEAAAMQTALERQLALAQDSPIVDVILAGAGSGHTFEASIIASRDTNFFGVTLDPAETLIRVARDNTEGGLLVQVARILGELALLNANLAKIVFAGAGAGATYMAILLASTQAAPGGNVSGCSFTNHLYVDNQSNLPPEAQKGSSCAPFETIQQANDFVMANAPAGVSEWVIHVNGGLLNVYFEDLTLTITPGAVVLLEYRGEGSDSTNQIGNFTYSDPASTGTRLRFTRFQAAVFGLFTATDGGAGPNGMAIELAGADRITGESSIFAFNGTGFGSPIFIDGEDSAIGPINAPTAIVGGIGMLLGGDLIVSRLERLDASAVDFTTCTTSTPSGPFLSTTFDGGTFTGPASSFVGDETAISTFLRNGGALAGAATFVYIDDDKGKAVTPFTVNTFANPQPVTLHEALQRIGNVVSVGQTVPIP